MFQIEEVELIKMKIKVIIVVFNNSREEDLEEVEEEVEIEK